MVSLYENMSTRDQKQLQNTPTDALYESIVKSGQNLNDLSMDCRIPYHRLYRIFRRITKPTFDEAVLIYSALGKKVSVS